MGRTGKTMVHLFLALLVVAFVSGCSGPNEIVETPPESVCTSLVDAKCVQCHYKTRICDALGKKSVSKWWKTIKFMIKQGAQLSDDEANKIVACLNSLPAGSDIVCK